MSKIRVIDSMSYYMIVKDNVKSPIFLKGVIHESFDETKYNEGMGYEWNNIFFQTRNAKRFMVNY